MITDEQLKALDAAARAAGADAARRVIGGLLLAAVGFVLVHRASQLLEGGAELGADEAKE